MAIVSRTIVVSSDLVTVTVKRAEKSVNVTWTLPDDLPSNYSIKRSAWLIRTNTINWTVANATTCTHEQMSEKFEYWEDKDNTDYSQFVDYNDLSLRTSTTVKYKTTDFFGGKVTFYVDYLLEIEYEEVVSESTGIFVKCNNGWEEVQKIYKKVNGSWIEINPSEIDRSLNYKYL